MTSTLQWSALPLSYPSSFVLRLMPLASLFASGPRRAVRSLRFASFGCLDRCASIAASTRVIVVMRGNTQPSSAYRKLPCFYDVVPVIFEVT